MSGKHYVDEIGTDIIVDAGCDITGATGTIFLVRKPNGTEEEWEAEVYESNYLKHTAVEGDLDQTGTYKLQISLTLTGWSGLGETDTFKIYAAFK